ncbi:hypothetical protein TrVE_jg2834 [Triparma verrucosa]|uniref:PLOD1-3-like GT domain-containing protein n=1 Tax=Triparma verrucosa TaxID=1606542 RepID=A0A9W7EP38_9STRA|nr:hypothetical protein TrVE_jg2834 [Triparma verrucosa]
MKAHLPPPPPVRPPAPVATLSATGPLLPSTTQPARGNLRALPKVPDGESGDSNPIEDTQCDGGIIAMTYATFGGKDDRFCRSIESAAQHDVPWRILGWGKDWHGLTQKLEGSLDALRNLPDECTVIFTDAYDVLYADDLPTIKRKYEEMGEPVLFAGECGCWPQITRDKGKGHVCLFDYPKSPTPYKYLNSGQWIAKKPAALQIFSALIEEAHVYADRYKVPISKINDQEMVSDMYMDGRFGIQLDHHNKIFQAMHATHDRPLEECDPWPEMENVDGVWENKVHSTSPSIFHFNGGGKIHHLEMERTMWYKQGANQNRAFLKKDELRRLKLRVGDGQGRLATFEEICPSYF